MTVQEHAQAVLDQLAASGSPALAVFDDRVRDESAPPYLVVRFTVRALGARDRPDASDLVMRSLPLEVTARIYSVAGNARAARALTQRVMTALLDWTPTVAGRSCSLMRHLDSWETPPNEQTGTAYFELGDEYRFTSYPA